MVNITEVHMSGGTGHEHIEAVKWFNPDNNAVNESTRETMVDWIKNKNGVATVKDGKDAVAVGVVDAKTPYIRTHANGKWSDNLLALPRY